MQLSKKTLTEIAHHEGLVREAYLDSVGVWTWGIGVTNASGHQVHPRYKDNPQTLEQVFAIFEWLLREKYLPAVERAFNRPLQEFELGGALSFHYNTGAIERADWVKSVNAGDMEKGYREIMNWRSPPEIIPRRECERELFFKDIWSCPGWLTEYPVKKPAYTPDWGGAKKIDIAEFMDEEG